MKGLFGTMAKKVTPLIGKALNGVGATWGVELLVSYLNILVGKGSGSGWDQGEEKACVDLLKARKITEPVVMDIGGNVGHWTREVRRGLGSNRGRWVIVEPAVECAKMCSALPNVELVEAAAGEAPARLKLFSNEGASAWASLHERGDSFTLGTKFIAREVPVVTIDSIIEQKGIDHIDFMKMDIEGHELFALRGARKALEARKISALSFEFGSGNVNSRTYFRDFWDFLTPLGYEIRRIVPGGSTVLVKKYYEDLESFRGVTNYIAVLK